jgi:hypothetical protein
MQNKIQNNVELIRIQLQCYYLMIFGKPSIQPIRHIQATISAFIPEPADLVLVNMLPCRMFHRTESFFAASFASRRGALARRGIGGPGRARRWRIF